FAINERGARHQPYIGDVLQWNLNEAVGRARGSGNGNMSDRVQILPVWLTESHHHREVPIAAAFVQIAGTLAADGGLNHGVDVAGRQTIARRAHPIDVDTNRRLPQRTE